MKSAPASLLLGDEIYRLMVESARDYAIFTTDGEGRVTTWNAGAERVLGFREDEIVGKDVRVVFTPEDNERGRADSEMDEALKSGRAEDRRQIVACAQLTGDGVAVLEQRVVHVEEVRGLVVAHSDRHLQREQPGVHLGALPHRRLTFGDVDLPERERQERHVPVGATAQPGDDMVVGDAGVGAAVVVGDGERAGHDRLQPLPRREHSRSNDRAASPRPAPTAMPATTSDA